MEWKNERGMLVEEREERRERESERERRSERKSANTMKRSNMIQKQNEILVSKKIEKKNTKGKMKLWFPKTTAPRCAEQ